MSDILIVAVQQKMNFLSCMSQFGSIISANGTCANDSVPHISNVIIHPGKILGANIANFPLLSLSLQINLSVFRYYAYDRPDY